MDAGDRETPNSACEAISAVTCAVAAYDQELMGQLLRIDGKDESVIYLAAVEKVN